VTARVVGAACENRHVDDRSTAGPDLNTPRARIDPAAPKPTCQYCLADPRCTPIALRPHPRCPVCGAPYSGPRREREYRVLLEAGLVATGD